jgi:NitT/TauT family transport system permease protein
VSVVAADATDSVADAGVLIDVVSDQRRASLPPGRRGTRGRRQHPLLTIRGHLGGGWRIALGVGGVLAMAILWVVGSIRLDGASSFLVPSPTATWAALSSLWSDGTLRSDLAASLTRVGLGYGISVLIGFVVGIAMGSVASAEALLEPLIGFLRYIPAGALIPLFLLWLGIGESPKITLIVVGTAFYKILMIADVARSVPRELLHASATLGAGRWRTLRKVIVPHSWPGVIDVARINLAAAWLMLVVAELLAAQEGLAFRIVRAQRFRAIDTMFALLMVFGLIGLVSDVLLRRLRWVVGRWARP